MKSVVVSKSSNNPLTVNDEFDNIRKEKEKQRVESNEEEEDSSSSNE